ncbi:MAG: DUF456 domain-containing protein [Candidatus Kerfeldbacteria bacterium]|nr:DUF456 domain-containing protein [Candidatus Kerfeldbacteria bacterium]
MEDLQSWITIIASLAILIGIYGLFSPTFPGVFVLWASVFAYALLTNFMIISQNVLMTITLLCGVIVAIDVVASARGTRHVKLNYLVVLGSIAVGLLFMTLRQNNLLWFLLGAIVGGTSVALLTGHDEVFELKTPKYILIGFAGATVLKLLIGMLIFGLFIQHVARTLA